MTTDEAMILALVALGALSVDDEGRVWRHREMTRGSATGGREIPCEPRRADTGRSGKGGYLRVQVTVGRDRFVAPAHRIVWMVANRRLIPDGLEINHRDGRKDWNHPTNLELATRVGNTLHALHTLGQYRTSRSGKLTPEMVTSIRDLRDRKVLSRAAVAEQFGISTVMVRKIEHRTSWAWVPEAASVG